MASFDTSSYVSTTQNIKLQLENMEKELKGICLEFIQQMPELKNINDGTSTPGMSDYSTEDEFKQGISRKNDADQLTLDDLIEYIANNYNHDEIDNPEISELTTKLQNTRKSFIDAVKKDAEELLKLQDELIAANQKEINEEKARVKELQATLIQLEEEKAMLEGQKTQFMGDPTKTADLREIEGKLQANGLKIINASVEIEELTVANLSNPGRTIAEHEKMQSDFIAKVQENRRELFQIFGKNNVDLQLENTQQPQNGAPVQTNNNAPAQTGNVVVENQTPEEVPEEKITCNSREEAKNILNNLMKSPEDASKILDSMGYGDIAAMIEHLGPINRRKLRTVLENRAEEAGITIEDFESIDITRTTADIDYFLNNYSNRTPKEIAEFEKYVRGIKYGCLLHNASRGVIRRKFNEIFNKRDEQIKNLERKMTSYHDKKSERSKKKFDLRNSLRQTLGKSKIEARPVETRANSNSKNTLQQRNVPSER